MSLSLTLNGQQRIFDELDAGATVAQLVEALKLKADRVALEHNGDIAPRTSWAAVQLGDGDRIELVHFVGGGSIS